MISKLFSGRILFGLLSLIGMLTITGFQDLLGKHNYQVSFPYITGHTFRNFCDHKIDKDTVKFDPLRVCSGDTIFVKTDYVGWFLQTIHPNIVNPYILVTHNSALGVPTEFTSYLNDENLYAWFGQNSKTYLHPKLFHLPLGLANRHWRHGNIEIVKRIQAQNHAKKFLLYMNFTPGTNKEIRTKVYELFRNKSYCYYQKKKNFESYLIDTAQSKFVLSPPGMGEDCHRVWEALYMGAIPIVQTSFLDPMFNDFPILIVDDWSKINENFLEQKYKEMSTKEYNLDKLYIPYWFKKIAVMQDKIR